VGHFKFFTSPEMLAAGPKLECKAALILSGLREFQVPKI
jgi:hypothetical protein